MDSRLPTSVEVAAYYVVSEMLTNTAKHACASSVDVRAAVVDRVLHVTVTDDGIGGADVLKGSGLVGIHDRVEAVGGHLMIHSPAGGGTHVHCAIPIAMDPAEPTGRI